MNNYNKTTKQMLHALYFYRTCTLKWHEQMKHSLHLYDMLIALIAVAIEEVDSAPGSCLQLTEYK